MCNTNKHIRYTRFIEHLPDYKFTDLDEGLSRTIKWFCENYERI